MSERHLKHKRVTVFEDDAGQYLRIPYDFALLGGEVEMYMEGDKLIIEPKVKKKNLLEVLESLEPLDEEDWLPEIEDTPPRPVNL